MRRSCCSPSESHRRSTHVARGCELPPSETRTEDASPTRSGASTKQSKGWFGRGNRRDLNRLRSGESLIGEFDELAHVSPAATGELRAYVAFPRSRNSEDGSRSREVEDADEEPPR